MHIFILALIICATSSFLIVYGINHADLWKGVEIEIREPSVRDLEDISDIYVIDKYVKEEINTYHDYRRLANEINKLQDDGTDALLLFGSPLCFVFIITKTMIRSFPDFPLFWTIVISIAISIAITVLPHFIINKMFPAPKFNITEQDLIKDYKSSNCPPVYPISERADINNFIISRHHWFLFSIHNGEQTRRTLKIIGGILMAIAFIFFT
jgi:hypothetical protein